MKIFVRFPAFFPLFALVAGAWCQELPPMLEIGNRMVRPAGVPDGTILTSGPTIRLHGTASSASGIERITWESDRETGGYAVLRVHRTGVRWETEPISLRPGLNRIQVRATDRSNQGSVKFVAVMCSVEASAAVTAGVFRRSMFRGKQVGYEVRDGRALYQGDIILGSQEEVAAEDAPAPGSLGGGRLAPRAASIAQGSYLWPTNSGVAYVPYTGSTTANINAAIATFNATFSGIVQWVPRTSEANYANWALDPNNHGGGCESSIGMVGGRQDMTGSVDCTISTILHEMGHAVGLWHEQSRADRNSYVSVIYANIDKPNASNFDQVLTNEVDLGLYDYGSVMHYGATLFGKFRIATTLESIPPGIPLSNTLGYSSGDIDAIKRLYGHVPTSVTIDTNPSGGQVLVDGVAVATPHTYSWALNSSHTLDVAAGPQTIGGRLCLFGRWNNQPGTAVTNPVTITPGNGTVFAPITAPAATVYVANFIPIYEYSGSTSVRGTSTVSPAPSLHFGGKDYFLNRQLISLTATPNAGFGFHEWFNASLFTLFANPNNLYMGTDLVNVLPDFMAAPVLTVATNAPQFPLVGAFPSLAVSVDGNITSTPQNFSWASSRTLDGTPANPSPVTTNISYAFANWSDGGAKVHAVTHPVNNSNQTITANYIPTYRAIVYSEPFCGGSVSPSGDSNVVSGSLVNYTASPSSGFTFVGWSGDFGGTTNPLHITVNDQIVSTANFNIAGTTAPLTISNVSPASVGANPNGMDLSISGTGFVNGAHATYGFWNNAFRSVTYNSPNSVTMHLNAGDLSSPGYKNIQLDNTPGSCVAATNWTFPITISSVAPSLIIGKVHSGNFTQGQTGATYTLTVSNATGAGATSGTVTVTETIPTGFSLVSMAGTNWNCSGGNTCTQTTSLAGGSSYAPITVTVNVAANAAASVVNQASVSGGGSALATASDPTTIVPLATRLVVSQPANGTVGTALAPVTVQVQDGGGSLVGSSSAAVRLLSSPAGIDVTMAAVGGVATFSNLVFNNAGAYTVTASSAGLTPAVSNPFTVSSAAVAPTVVIDGPIAGAVISSGTVVVSGWALDNATAVGTAISKVQVTVDGTLIGNATYGTSRSDVCGVYPGRPGCPHVGFLYSVSLALLSPGAHTITVSATDSDGAPNVGSASVNVTVAPLVMATTRVGVSRGGTQFLEDVNGNGTVDGPDRFLTTFAPPGGVVSGDLALVGDWNGDGHAKAGYYRPANGTWWLDVNNDGVFGAGDATYTFGGLGGDLPVVGDWNGVAGASVHKSCIGIYRTQGSVWLLDLNCNGSFDNTPTDAFFPFGGLAGDVPVVGNFTGGTTRVGVVRKYAPLGVPQGEPFFWVYDASNANAGNTPADHPPASAGAFPFGGLAGDQFITGDWLGTGSARAGVYRGGLWVLDGNGLHNPDLILSFGGLATDKAISGKW